MSGVRVCTCTCVHLSGWSLKALFFGLVCKERDHFLLRKLENTFGVKFLGWIDEEVEVQIEIGLNNIQDNYLYSVDF